MKRLMVLFISVAACIISLMPSDVKAQSHAPQSAATIDVDSIEISLLTCAPGNEAYSIYGHTAIRVANLSKSNDGGSVINYGLFSFNKPFFALRFLFGLTDYEVGELPFSFFLHEYENDGRAVTQQVLNLTAEEKQAILKALMVNLQPWNRVYRYNIFYANCTTKARDIIASNIDGKLIYKNAQEPHPSFRQQVEAISTDHPWMRAGADLLLGLKADRQTSLDESQFLPSNLENDFSSAIIRGADGTTRPLVKESRQILPSRNDSQSNDLTPRPSTCAWIVLALTIALSALETWRKKDLWVVDIVAATVCGCVGIVLLLLIFSQHPTTSVNLHILMFNPLALLLIYRAATRIRRKREDKFWIYAACSIILFLLGGFFQSYAEGTLILALSLLVRCVLRINKYKHYR